MPKVKPIPEGYAALTPTLTVKDTRKAIEFYQKAFGASQAHDLCEMPGGKIGHAEVMLGGCRVMISDEFPEMGCVAPSGKTRSNAFFLYVTDVDATFKKAIAAGAKSTMPVADQFWGDRMGQIEDPFGHRWSIGTHIEDVTPEQMKERMDKQFAAGACK